MYNKRRESIGRFRTSNFYRIRLSAPDSPVPTYRVVVAISSLINAQG